MWCLERFYAAGVDVLSITLAGDDHNISQVFSLCAWARQQLREREGRMMLVRRVSDIELAREGLAQYAADAF
jgi:hypothetical protein